MYAILLAMQMSAVQPVQTPQLKPSQSPLLPTAQTGAKLPNSAELRTRILPRAKMLPRQNEPGKFPLRQSITTPPLPGQLPQINSPDNLTRFNYRNAEVRWTNNRWELAAGKVWLKDFGSRQRDARDALRVIRQLRLTERGVIGSPSPVMEYWLSNGHAPRAFGSGFRMTPIDPNSLRVEMVKNHWVVRDDRQLFFNFGVQKKDADQAAAVIRKHGFTQVGYVGYPQPAMIYFADGHNGLRSSSLRPPRLTVKRIPKDRVPNAKSPDAKAQPQHENRLATLRRRQEQQSAQYLARGYRQLGRPLGAGATRIRFDSGRTVVRRDGDRWKLYSGNHALADLGTDAAQAQQAALLLRRYNCNEHCVIGGGAQSFSYFLANGRAPRGIGYGMQGRKITPANIAVKRTGQGWCVCDGEQPLVTFGRSQRGAVELATAIQRYQFDFVTQLGSDTPFLLRSK